MQAIKAQLHQRQQDHARRNGQHEKVTPQSLEQLMEAKLLALRKEQELQQTMNPKKDLPRSLPELPPAEFQALVDRTTALKHYAKERHHLEIAERTANEKVAAADAVAEKLKDQAMELIHNGLNYCFDDRALLWRSIVATRTESENLRHDANETISTLEQTKLVDPYARFKTLVFPETHTSDSNMAAEPTECDVWLIGRRGVIETTEENSDTILYYGAYFEVTDGVHDSPKDGMRWLPCSDHAVEPAPVVQHKRATVDSWIVSGAGVAAVNGIYVLSGKYEGASKYTSIMGLELFRKRFSLETNDFGNVEDMAVSGVTASGAELPLPAKFRAIYNERDFRVMQQIGSWLATQEMKAKTRAEAIKESHRKVHQDTSASENAKHITIQPMHTEAAPLVPSRPHVVSRLCRAWVLMQCHVPMCPQRHYFISHQERDAMKKWQLATEATLELDILRAITARELMVERATAVASKAMTKYMANLHVETSKQVQKLVMALSGLRLVTVHVIEAIEKWRKHIQLMGRMSTLHTTEADEVKYGWSASITVTTGKLLYKGSNAFHSKVKRYCRDADIDGEAETQVRYLGYFPTKVEAERAYDNAVVAEARRMRTTVDHMPKKRYVFLSCGVHFAIESDDKMSNTRKKKSRCIECRAKVVAAADSWSPTYLWHGTNYILKLGSDLDFLEDITPLKAHVGSSFPLLGNPFLVPQSAIQDPERFIALSVPETQQDAAEAVLGPHLTVTVHANQCVAWTNPDTQETFIASPNYIITTATSTQTRTQFEVLDMLRLQRAQQVFLHEIQRTNSATASNDTSLPSAPIASAQPMDEVAIFRRVQALYWDRCAALRIQHIRPARAFRQPNVWCRLDAGEWANFRVRGKHLRHLLFHKQLYDTGAKTHSNRRVFIQKLRTYMQLGWEQVDRHDMEALLLEAEVLRGDVVKLETSNLVKFMAKFDRINDAVELAQRWWRQVVGKWRARARTVALRVLAQLRLQFQTSVCSVAKQFVLAAIATASRNACSEIEKPAYSTILKLDGEHVVVTWHSLFHASSPLSSGQPCLYCLRQPHQASIHASGFKFQKDQVICCCQAEHSPERVLVRAYNPATSELYRIKLGNDRMRQILRPRVDGFLSRACELKPLPTDRILNYDPKYAKGRRRTCWEPIFEAQTAHSIALGMEKAAQCHEKVVEALLQKVTAWRALHTNNLQVKKRTWAAFQKAKAQVERADSALQESVLRTKDAMAFSERAKTSLMDEQPWDDLENANNWKLLVAKRLIAREVADKEAQLELARMEWFHAEMNEASTRACTAEAKVRFENAAAFAKRVRLRANEFRAMANTAHLMMVTALRTLSGLLALRFTSSLPIRRNLTFLDTKQEHIHVMPSKLHTVVSRRGFDYNLLVARAKKVCAEPIRHTCPLPQHWIVQVRTLAESATVDTGVLVSMYRPRESHVVDAWVEARFLMLMMTQLRFRDPLAVAIQSHMKTAATQTMHGSAASRKLLLMTECAHALIHLIKLNPFSGAVTIGRVDFFRVREALQSKLVQSHWWHDLCRGRQRGRGDEVYRQATNVHGCVCHVVIHENWGDLTVQLYEPRSRQFWTCKVPLADTIHALRVSPTKLQHWLLCVRTNRYSDAVFEPILQNIVLRGNAAIFQVRKSAGKIVYRGVRFVRHRYLLVTMREDMWQHLVISAIGLDEKSNVHGDIHLDPSGRRAMFPGLPTPTQAEFLSLMGMLAIEPKPLSIRLQDGSVVASAIHGFNAWVNKSKRWRNPLSNVEDKDLRRWCCDADSTYLHAECSSEWRLVLRRSIAFEDTVSPLVYDRPVVYMKEGKLVHNIIEVFPRHGAFFLRLRFVDVVRSRRSEMDAEEVLTRSAVALEQRR
ncbi:hypothetical protein H310_01156 [Aphanomyces invadans]|uniref:Uncharacterized protein n=1 Tax=Aphanomyces invadans TaxID=157072 RepID=A0A024UR14_9STRA|nr:hypothetical protein H310_01156 [Aphanomyces invadans]ETW08615.1 hypothetical protein H310_01156 [Aphanomyces invadans]|eukprot:XP_008862420.1 hypothetical protein H310_01156 [Aphanomyces invadans]